MVTVGDSEVRAWGEAGYFVRRDAVGAGQTAAALRQARDLPLRPAAIGGSHAVDTATRSDETIWIDGQTGGPLAELYAWFGELSHALNEAAYLGLRSFEVQLARYAPGAAYARHRDTLRGTDRRRATATLYLNDDWKPEDGGLLRLHLPSGSVDVEPRSGTLVCFASERVEHEVLTSRAPRFALTAWFHPR